MKHIFILLLLFWDNVEFTLTQQECSQLPSAEHASVSDEYKKVEYLKGDVIYFSCDPGYTTGFNTTYICTEHGWRATTYGQCIVKGTVPLPLGCPQAPALTHGYTLNNSTYFYPHGQKVRYKCNDFYKLKGGPYKTCTNGQWIGDLQCVASFCERPQVDNGTLEEDKQKYAENEVLRYSCDRGYRKVTSRPSCLMVDWAAPQWSPSPQCDLITCKLSARPPAGTRYDPVNQIIFGVGQRVTVLCGEKQWVKSRELQSAQLICQETGNWDVEPVVCQLVTCTKSAENVYNWQNMWYTSKMDETVWYQCHRGYEETARRARCTREGWEPNPLCREKRCPKPLYRNAEITDNYKKDTYEHEAIVNFRCLYDQPEVTFQVDCSFGQWRGSVRTCREKTCTTQPHVENGDMLDERKREYQHRERVRFQCQGETGNFGVTCQSGEWMTEKRCAGKCGSTAIPNGLSYELQNKLYYTCNQGFKLLGGGWWGVASCEAGAWKTSECVAATDCGSIPDIPNMIVRSESPRFSDGETFPIQCETGYQNTHPDLQVLTCSKGSWNSNNVKFKDICTPIAAKCSPPPKVRNAVIMASLEKQYLSGTRLTYKCRGNFIEEGQATIQCINGIWERTSFRCQEPPNPQ